MHETSETSDSVENAQEHFAGIRPHGADTDRPPARALSAVTMLLVEALLLLLLAARRDVRAAKGFQHYEACEKCVDAGLVRGLFPPLNLLFAVTVPY
eukprot:COSAG05_NODE_3865_length_1798_cov_4.480283_3_plen_97_part_00